MGYALLQSTRPQSVAYPLTDSPVGLLSSIVERFEDWTASQERPEDAVDRDAMLTNVMLYWLFQTAGSSARYYFAGACERASKPDVGSVLTALAIMPEDISRPVRRIAEQTDNIVRWQPLSRGATSRRWEEPELLVADLRDALRPYR